MEECRRDCSADTSGKRGLFERTPFPTGAQVVTAGIGLFILLPILRVILMLTIFVKERDYKFSAAAAAVVLLIIFAGFAIGILSK